MLSKIESFAMISPALNPVPLHEDMVILAMKMLCGEPDHLLISQAHEMNTPSQIGIEDWNNLFHAVEARLCACVAAGDMIDDKIRVAVLECVEALGQLHGELTLERQQRQTLKVFDH